MASTLGQDGIEGHRVRTVGNQCSLWEAMLPEHVRRLPEELAPVDAYLDDPRFIAPFVAFFDPQIGRRRRRWRPICGLKSRYGLVYELLCREVSDSIAWRRFCRIPLEGSAAQRCRWSIPRARGWCVEASA